MRRTIGAPVRYQIAARNCIGATGHVTQASHLAYTSIINDLPLIIVVKRGRKHLRLGGDVLEIQDGEAVAISAGQAIDFENVPVANGDYEARWLAIEPELILKFSRPDSSRSIVGVCGMGRLSDGLSHAFEQAVDALSNPQTIPDLVAGHKVSELLAWLAADGHCFSPISNTSYTARIRRMVSAKTDHGWTSDEIGFQLGVSEATLRRRLALEGASLRSVLSDVRMTQAMQLLQCSNLPVSEIAARAGFESQSRFAIRFRHRFGFPPTAIRGHRRAQSG